MRKNFTHTGTKAADNRIYLPDDWFSAGLPSNVVLGKDVYIDTSYGFDAFCSDEVDGFEMQEGSGSYDRSSFIASNTGRISIGSFTILNGTNIICRNKITIGNHCMISWNTIITDSWIDSSISIEKRQAILYACAEDPLRSYPFPEESKPVVIEDNCWVGFGSIIMPGVTLGRGCIIGCNTIVMDNVPAYAVVAGSPQRILRYLPENDTEKARIEAMKVHLK